MAKIFKYVYVERFTLSPQHASTAVMHKPLKRWHVGLLNVAAADPDLPQ